MTRFQDLILDLALRAGSAARHREDLVMSLEEAIIYHEFINGRDVPYRHPERLLGVRIKVLEP